MSKRVKSSKAPADPTAEVRRRGQGPGLVPVAVPQRRGRSSPTCAKARVAVERLEQPKNIVPFIDVICTRYLHIFINVDRHHFPYSMSVLGGMLPCSIRLVRETS